MANLPASPTWSADVYQIETTDAVLGGASGVINVQARQLADRTAYLKAEVEDVGDVAAGADGKADYALEQISEVGIATGAAAASASAALGYRDAALVAKALAVQARQGAEAAASQSSDNAQYAIEGAATAQNKASEAQSAATAAVSAAGTALGARAAVEAARNAAQEAQAGAEAAMYLADGIRAEVRNWYYGPLGDDPVLRPDGTVIQVGDEYQNTTAHVRKVYANGAWRDVSAAALASSSGASLVGFDATLNYASGTLGAHFQGEVNIKDFPWLSKCDGTTDDSAAFWACVTFAKANGYTVFHPGGVCRITFGLTQSTAYHNINLRGNGRLVNAFNAESGASTFMLDSASASSHFLTIAANTLLTVTGLKFKCAQAVPDRAFFKFSASFHNEFFTQVDFFNVERPIVWAAGSYFQNAAFRDVQFSDSGTFHSECPNVGGSLLGTLLTLDNVNHEGSPGDAGTITEKIVCNLRGIRKIFASNFLLEGSLPATGWTILRLHNLFDAAYTRDPFAEINNFWSEWTGNSPAYTVDQIGGNATISGHLGLTLTNKYKLSSLGRVNIVRSGFIYTTDEASLFFELQDRQCVVSFTDCSMRAFDLTKVGFVHNNTQWADVNASAGGIAISNAAPVEMYRWTGGSIEGDGAGSQVYTGAGLYPSADATYGRKLVLVPSAGALSAVVRFPTLGKLRAGAQAILAMKVKLPAFSTGLWAFNIEFDYANQRFGYFDAASSGAVVDVLTYVVVGAAPPNEIEIRFSNGTTSGATGNVEVYSMAMYMGHSAPQAQFPLYPPCISTLGTAIPTLGAWAKGDRIVNHTPAVGSPKGWVCTVAGTPGTWVSEGNL